MLEYVRQALRGEHPLAPLHQPPRVGSRHPGAGALVQRAELHGEQAEEEMAVPRLQPFLAALVQDLFVPLFNGFEQHGSELLQVDQLRDLLFSPAGEENAPYPHDKSSPQTTLVRTWYRGDQIADDRAQLFRAPSSLQTDEQGNQVVALKLGLFKGFHINEQVPQPRYEGGQRSVDPADQLGKLPGSKPPCLSIVNDDREDQGEQAIRGQPPLLQELLQEESEVDRLAQSHEPLGRRLELDEQVDGDGSVAQPHPPADIAIAALEAFGDMGGAHPLQSGEVKVVDPGLAMADVAADEILDQTWLRKQKPEAAVVLFQGQNSSCPYKRRKTARRSHTYFLPELITE